MKNKWDLELLQGIDNMSIDDVMELTVSDESFSKTFYLKCVRQEDVEGIEIVNIGKESAFYSLELFRSVEILTGVTLAFEQLGILVSAKDINNAKWIVMQ